MTTLLQPCLVCGRPSLTRLCLRCRNRTPKRGQDRIGEEVERYQKPKRRPGRPRKGDV